jgi:hypothetical protein
MTSFDRAVDRVGVVVVRTILSTRVGDIFEPIL